MRAFLPPRYLPRSGAMHLQDDRLRQDVDESTGIRDDDYVTSSLRGPKRKGLLYAMEHGDGCRGTLAPLAVAVAQPSDTQVSDP
jgi:hypothetical protein